MMKERVRIFCELHQYCYSDERSLERSLREILRVGFQAKMLIARHDHDFADLGYTPNRWVRGLGSVEHVYEEMAEEDVITVACQHPQRARYLLLQKDG